MNRRVLMVTPVWPPLGSIGVRRVVRLARGLPAFGWDPVVLTDEPTGSGRSVPPILDVSQPTPPAEVHRARGLMPLARPRRALEAALGARLGGLFHRLTEGLLLPDHYLEWAPAAVRAARRIPDVDVVWTTGAPFGTFAVAALVAQALGRPLVLDYRDPWSQAGLPSRNPLRWPDSLHARLEAVVLARAAGVAYVNPDMFDRNEAAFGRPPGTHWVVIPNGYDPADLGDDPPWQWPRPVLLHAGNCYGGRSLAPVVHALTQLEPSEKSLQIQYFGVVDPLGAQALAAAQLGDRVEVHGRVSFAEIGQRLRGASALLLIGSAQHRHALTGKLFDYIAAQRPILGIGPPDASVGQLIREAGLGVWVDEADGPGLVAALKAVEAGTLPFAPRLEMLRPWSAVAMAERTAALLQAVTH